MSKTRVLIADDEANMRITLADILEDEGYEVATAASGERAVELGHDAPYDVILMDFRMTGIDGVEATRRLRQTQKAARVIFMSAYATDEVKRRAFEAGATAFLAKPLDLDSVLKLIGEARETAVLVVEADAGVAGRLSEAFKEHGYWVRAAHHAGDALELAAQIRFDVIFLDMQLPRMNGLDLYLAIRRISPYAVVIMMCAPEPALEAMAREAVRQTAYTIVHKPPDLAGMVGLLAQVTDQRVAGTLRKPGEDDDS